MVRIVVGDIFDAALQGNILLTEALLSTPMVDIDDRSSDASTPLMVAAQEGHLRVVKALLHAGAGVNLSNDSGWTALMASSSRGHLDIAKSLVGAGAEIDALDEDGVSPLNTAAQSGHAAVVDFLIGAGAKVHRPDKAGLSPLHKAAMYGHPAATARLLASAGAKVDASDNRGDSPLIHASNNGHAPVAELLIAAGADLELADRDGKAPVHRAAQAGRAAEVRALLAAGADRESRTRVGETPLLLAAINGRLDVVRVLLRAGADPARPMVLDAGKTFVALDAAAQQGRTPVARELLALGVDACGGPRRGVVGLCLAAQRENLEMLETLTDGGVVDTGKALYDSCNQGREASVRFLLRQDWGIPRRAYVSSRNYLGYTPLWLAAAAASPKIVRWLLDAGADESAACTNTNRFQFEGPVVTPLGFAVDCIRQMRYRGKLATEEQLRRIQAVRRLLVRVDAVRATSWLWCNGVASAVASPAGGSAKGSGAKADGTRNADGGRPTTALNVAIVRDRRRVATTRAFFRYSSKSATTLWGTCP